MPDYALPSAVAGDPLLREAYQQAADRSILSALNPDVFFGYFSVCGDGRGHGGNTTFPGLDWGQSAEALLYLGRIDHVLASWEYVKGFQRADGLIPFAILPDLAGSCHILFDKYPLHVMPSGGVFEHWSPGNPLRTLANVTFLLLAAAIFRHTKDHRWLGDQISSLRLATEWLFTQVSDEGYMAGGGFYIERPARLEYDGVNQCYSVHALRSTAHLFEAVGEYAYAASLKQASERLTAAFRSDFWTGTQCVEYIDIKRGPISSHGLTDVDWAAVATGVASPDQVDILWPQLRDNADFTYDGIPTGIATKPEAYEDWEFEMDRHDLAAMGRVWYLECWARSRMGDIEGILRSMRMVAEVGKSNGWSWHERYYSATTGDLSKYTIEWYCEYPANLIRIANQFLL